MLGLEIVKNIWLNKMDDTLVGFISMINPTTNNFKEYKITPNNLGMIHKLFGFSQENKYNIYFCPNLFKGDYRSKELVVPNRFLYADLDESYPFYPAFNVEPSVTWITSSYEETRRQCLWELDDELYDYLIKENKFFEFNKYFTQKCKADPSGYDCTQLLRIPGSTNFKPKYGVGSPGRLEKITKNKLYLLEYKHIIDNLKTSQEESWDVFSFKYTKEDKEKLLTIKDSLVGSYIRFKRGSVYKGDFDRSNLLYGLTKDLKELGFDKILTFKVLYHSPINKFKDRSDEEFRLKELIGRVYND